MEATLEPKVFSKLADGDQWTRVHSFSEVFSTLSGGRLGFRIDADDAVALLRQLIAQLDVVELTAGEVLDALESARALGIRGGRVHDYLHALAAKQVACEAIRTWNTGDFEGQFPEIRLLEP